jgi:hypothetical protein
LVVPLKTIVLPAKHDLISFDGDLNADGINDNDQEKDEDGISELKRIKSR